MVDRYAIEALFATYARANDVLRSLDDIADCFATDATAVFTIAGELAATLEGREQIRAFYAQTLPPPTRQMRHVITNIRILERAAAADRTALDAYLTVLVTDDYRAAATIGGAYEVEVVETPDGVRFSRFNVTLDSAP